MKTRKTVKFDSRAQHRLLVLNHVLAGELAVAEAALYLHLSVARAPAAEPLALR